MNNYFTSKQRQVLRQANKRWNILTGAVRSGKTFVSYFLIPERVKEHYDNNILFVGKTVNTLDRNVFDPMRSIFGDKYISKIIDKRFVYIFGKRCYVVGANDERSITKIQGLSLGYCYCDELTTYPESFFQMLKSRLDLSNSKCDATCNPESPSHFVKQHIDNNDLDIYTEHFTIYDNDRLPAEFVKNLENEYRGTVYFDKWILGKWVKSEGLVFPLFRREKHYITYQEYLKYYGSNKIKYVIWGVDGATTNDSTAIVPVAILQTGQAVVLDLFYHNPKVNGQLSNEQLIPYIKQYMDDMESKYRLKQNGAYFYTTVDCAAADLKITLGSHLPAYFNVHKYTKKDIQQTTDIVNNALGRNAVIILDIGGYYNYVRRTFVKEVSPLVVDIENMTWDADNKKYDPSVPNDCADAFRYALCAYFINPDNLWSTPEANIYFKERIINE
ncbi:MAG: phage terminase large subunit [Clostridia bacterium]|nr:phage terminase large subunit [Clostridia bacterium]